MSWTHVRMNMLVLWNLLIAKYNLLTSIGSSVCWVLLMSTMTLYGPDHPRWLWLHVAANSRAVIRRTANTYCLEIGGNMTTTNHIEDSSEQRASLPAAPNAGSRDTMWDVSSEHNIISGSLIYDFTREYKRTSRWTDHISLNERPAKHKCENQLSLSLFLSLSLYIYMYINI